MPETKPVLVSKLTLDLSNYRTVVQLSEAAAIEAMISTSPDRFWALTESLIQDGYLPTESVIVLRSGAKMVVKEGNRRIAAMKLIHGVLPIAGLAVPDTIAASLATVTSTWRKNYASAPCTIYEANDASTVDRIVTLAHGKGEKAGRDQWNAVARARHNRDAKGGAEPALDLLEKYLAMGKNVTANQRGRWAGAFPLSVLSEAMKKIAPRLGVASSSGLAASYPAVKFRDELEAILHSIGLEQLGFERIREKSIDFGGLYGLPGPSNAKANSASASPSTAGGKKTGGTAAPGPKGPPKAVSITDPRAIRRLLKDFAPKGKKRGKVVALRDEAITLDVRITPLAFCFVLRSMFEISAKAYCSDHSGSGGPSPNKANGQQKQLVDLLDDITNHLTNNKKDIEATKQLHGSMTELGKPEGLLSVTSLNQLIHNPAFAVGPTDIALLFGNVYPLIEAMNA